MYHDAASLSGTGRVMAANDLDWDDLRLFAVLARAGSVRRAAQALDVHASTVTRRLEHFERQLDVKLFNRNPGGLRISPAGEEVLARVEQIAAGIADIERTVAGADRRLAGPLRVSLPDAVAHVVMPAMASFARAWPDIRIEFVAAAMRPDVGQREADCALSITNAPPQHLIGRRVGRLAMAAYESVASREAGPAGWVELEAPAELRSELRQRDFLNVPVVARSRDLATQLAALCAGLGVGPLPCAIGDAEPDLVRAAATTPLLVGELWLLTHPDLRSTTRVRECMKVLTQALQGAQALLLGQQPRPAT